MNNPCRIIGVLDDGAASLSFAALEHIQQADVIIGGHRALALFEGRYKAGAQQRDLTGHFVEVPEWVKGAQADGLQTVVLATGDPLCHGIAKFLIAKLGKEVCEVLPNCSTLQLAFSRIGLSWQDAKICSVHGKDAGEWHVGATPKHGLHGLLQTIVGHDKLSILTSPENGPDRIARMLVSEGLDQAYSIIVAEHLQQADERVISNLSVAEAAQQVFADPNIVILFRKQALQPSTIFGLPDDRFQQRKPDKGLITKREVRAVSLARMQLRPDSVVWDIGAGSGSVGLEAARLCPQGHVFAIEKNEADAENALVNQKQLGVHNYTLLCAKAPSGLDEWVDPDAVFIGGSAGELAGLIELILQRLKPDGWLVMNFVTFENLATAIEVLKQLGAEWDITQLQASRSKPVLDMYRLNAENPVWIVSAQVGSKA